MGASPEHAYLGGRFRGEAVSVSVADCIRAGRALVQRFNGRQHPEGWKPERVLIDLPWVRGELGTCKWCLKPCSKRRQWHRFCARAFRAAKGMTRHANGQAPLIAHAPCEVCGEPGAEVDHRIALAVARRLPEHVWIRAWWIGNLRWLCEEHHVAKTTADRRMMAALDRVDAGVPQQQRLVLS